MIKKIPYGIILMFLVLPDQSCCGFFDQILRPSLFKRKNIVEDARRNMPPELQSCKSLEDAEALLRQEEKRRFDAIKEEFWASNEAWEDLSKKIEAKKEYFRNVVLKAPHPKKDHSLSTIDPELFQHVVQALHDVGINEDAVSIVYDQATHDRRPYYLAFAVSYDEHNDIPSKISLVPNNKLTNARTIEEHTELDPYHEAIHIIEIHRIQDNLIRETLKSLPSHEATRNINSYKSIKNWKRTWEKIADLVPLIQFKNPKHVELMYQRCMCDCVNKINEGEKIRWNQTTSATHPSACAEILPWILKIHDLMQDK